MVHVINFYICSMITQIKDIINMPLFDGVDSKNDSALVSLGMLSKEKLAFDSNKRLLTTIAGITQNSIIEYVKYINTTQTEIYDN